MTNGGDYSGTIQNTYGSAAAVALAVTGGTLTLEGTNTFSGGTTVTGGALAISNDENLGGSAGTLTLDGGTLQAASDFISVRTISLGSGGGTFDTNNQNVTLSGQIGDSGASIYAL